MLRAEPKSVMKTKYDLAEKVLPLRLKTFCREILFNEACQSKFASSWVTQTIMFLASRTMGEGVRNQLTG